MCHGENEQNLSCTSYTHYYYYTMLNTGIYALVLGTLLRCAAHGRSLPSTHGTDENRLKEMGTQIW